MTLKTGVMTTENSALYHKNKLHFIHFIYFNINYNIFKSKLILNEIIFHNITLTTIFYQINTAFVSMKHLSKTFKNLESSSVLDLC